MFHLIARVKNRGKTKHYKLLSDQKVFDIDFDELEFVEYSPETNLDEGAWFKVSNFLEKEYCIDLLKKPFVSGEYDEITKDKYEKIAYITSFQEDDFYFQKVTPSSYLKSKSSLCFGEKVTFEEGTNRIFISEPDAIFRAEKGELLFKNLATISSIFSGIDILYKEATKEQVQDFMGQSFIDLKGGFKADKVSKPNRKRIALAMDTLAKMSKDDQGIIFDYIIEYCDDMTFDKENKSFEIEDDNSLKKLLYGIEQRFYTTRLGDEKRIANSIEKI